MIEKAEPFEIVLNKDEARRLREVAKRANEDVGVVLKLLVDKALASDDVVNGVVATVGVLHRIAQES